jgi:ubiquinone/menaquinone biosynthesis C-methylase UbiE
MPDVYATIEQAEEDVQTRLADVLELRAADLQQRAMLEDYLSDLPLRRGARVLEIGCGPGPIARTLAARPEVGEVVGIDPSAVFVERARARAAEIPNLSFVMGDGRELPFEDESFDAVVCHTSLCHIPEPERVLAEARRVTTPGGMLALFDGDYITTTVALYEGDPLQACADAAMRALVHDLTLVRRLPTLVREAGFQVVRLRSHGYAETAEPHYMLTIVDRGADALVTGGRLGAAAAEALKEEARRRAEAGEFFGHIAYASLIARGGGVRR